MISTKTKTLGLLAATLAYFTDLLAAALRKVSAAETEVRDREYASETTDITIAKDKLVNENAQLEDLIAKLQADYATNAADVSWLEAVLEAR